MTKILAIGDIHAADKPPSIRTESYRDDILAKVKFCADEAERQNADLILLAGDVFHLKTPHRTSHYLVRQMTEILTSVGLPVVICIGNHDIRNDSMTTLSDQPLTALATHPMISLADGKVPDWPIFSIPYLLDWETQLPAYMKAWQESDAILMVAHAPIVKPDTTLPFNVINATDWATMMDRGGLIFYGHMHTNDGIYFAGEDWQFCNHGALSRGSLHEETLDRKPACTLIDTEAMTFTRIEVPHKKPEDAFRLAQHLDKKETSKKLDAFLESLSATTLDEVTAEAVVAHASTQDVRPEVRAEIEDLLETAGDHK